MVVSVAPQKCGLGEEEDIVSWINSEELRPTNVGGSEASWANAGGNQPDIASKSFALHCANCTLSCGKQLVEV